MNSNLPALTDDDNVAGKTLLVRGALNVPINSGRITEDFRLRQLLPTISWLKTRGARVILIGHLSGADTNSFELVADYLRDHTELTFVKEYLDNAARDIVANMADGDVLLFENLRQHPGEKANDREFAENLARYADAYVQDAFPAAHREHASIVTLPKLLPAFAGKQFVAEVKHLSRALEPTRPLVFILGGAKFSTKLPLSEKFVSVADHVFVGGAIANAYLKAAGFSVGNSTAPEGIPDLDKGLSGSVLKLPTDLVCQDASGEVETKEAGNVGEGDTIVDIGHRSLDRILETLDEAAMVVWNGPLGWYEKGFSETTDELADKLAATDTQSIIGGGDTAAVLLDDHSADDFSFVSTAGGAMIQFLANETLPGIEALRS